MIDSTGQLGTVSSSRRYKTNIKPIENGSESILALQPVSFRYKVHNDATPQFGLIAEEVAQVNPDLVIYDLDGKPYTVRYDAVNAMLLNEFLKQHKRVQQQETTILKLQADAAKQQSSVIELKKTLENVLARMSQHDAKIQKISAEIELSRNSPMLASGW